MSLRGLFPTRLDSTQWTLSNFGFPHEVSSSLSGRKYLLSPDDILQFKEDTVDGLNPLILLHALPFTYGESVDSWTYPGYALPMKLSDRSMHEICKNINKASGYPLEDLHKRFPLDFDAEGKVLKNRKSDGPGCPDEVIIDGQEVQFLGIESEDDFYFKATNILLFTNLLEKIKCSLDKNSDTSVSVSQQHPLPPRRDPNADQTNTIHQLQLVKTHTKRLEGQIRDYDRRKKDLGLKQATLEEKQKLLEEREAQLEALNQTRASELANKVEVFEEKQAQWAVITQQQLDAIENNIKVFEGEKLQFAANAKKQARNDLELHHRMFSVVEKEKELEHREDLLGMELDWLRQKSDRLNVEMKKRVDEELTVARADLEAQRESLDRAMEDLRIREDCLTADIAALKQYKGKSCLTKEEISVIEKLLEKTR